MGGKFWPSLTKKLPGISENLGLSKNDPNEKFLIRSRTNTSSIFDLLWLLKEGSLKGKSSAFDLNNYFRSSSIFDLF